MRRLLPGLLAVTLLLTGCGDDDDVDATAADTASESDTESGAPTVRVPEPV